MKPEHGEPLDETAHTRVPKKISGVAMPQGFTMAKVGRQEESIVLAANPDAESRRLARARSDNASTSDNWTHYASHRATVTSLLSDIAESTDTVDRLKLCILGAGNGNDLDLRALAKSFASIHLVDIDQRALQAGVVRDPGLAVHRHGGYNVDHVDALGHLLQVLDGPCDVVVSTALLSQLLIDRLDELEPTSSTTAEHLLAVRSRHLRLMADLLRPGGTGLLVNDLVSSITLPNLARIPRYNLPNLMTRTVESGNFFTGCNPYAILQQLTVDTALVHLLREVRLYDPWIWHMTEAVARLTYAISFRRVRDA